jgi:hypothetical protein
MFKGKQSLYILLPVNLLVWSFIAYKIISAIQSDDLPDVKENPVSFKQATLNDSIVYHLDLNYEDPFLKQEPERKTKIVKEGLNKVQNQPVKPIIIKPEKVVKDIKYLGTVQNKTSGLTMAMISINGNTHVIKKGDIVEGVTFQSISQDEIVLRDDGKTLKISK